MMIHVVLVFAGELWEVVMKKIDINNERILAIQLNKDGSITCNMNSQESLDSVLTWINRHFRNVLDSLEDSDEQKCRFGFDATIGNKAILFTGDITQALDFCTSMDFLSRSDRGKILTSITPEKKGGCKPKILGWMKSATSELKGESAAIKAIKKE